MTKCNFNIKDWHMKKLLLIAVCSGFLWSCIKTGESPVPVVTETEDPDWIELKIPEGREAYAIAGDIDHTLLVTTWTKAFYTTDQGKTWNESKNFDGPIPGLLVRNDTTFALHMRRYGPEGLLGAWDALYFSPDYGKTWAYYLQHYKEYLDDVLPIGTVQSQTGVTYSIKSNSTPINSASAYINPSELVRKDAMGQRQLTFPFKRNLTNVYLDTKGRLYVASSGGTYQPESNTFYCCPKEYPALVYISRKPLP